MVTMLMTDTIGARVRQAREAQELTQGQVAQFASVKQSWLSAVETGEVDDPGILRMVRVARVLHVDLDYLATGYTDRGGVTVRNVKPENAQVYRELEDLDRQSAEGIVSTVGQLARTLYGMKQRPGNQANQ